MRTINQMRTNHARRTRIIQRTLGHRTTQRPVLERERTYRQGSRATAHAKRYGRSIQNEESVNGNS